MNNYSELIFLSSIASERARRSNFIYGAGKSMLTTYVKSLQHKHSNNQFRIKLIKLGPIRTIMLSKSKSSPPFSIDVFKAVRMIVESLKSNKQVIYIPKKWKYIMLLIKSIPSVIFNKIDI